MKIEALRHEADLNAELLAKIAEFVQGTEKDGIKFIRQTVSQLASTSAIEPPSADKEPRMEQMVLNLLTQILSKINKDKLESSTEDVAALKELRFHQQRLLEREAKRKVELETEEAEAKKHITSEDVHDGFDVSVSIRRTSFLFYSSSLRTFTDFSFAGQTWSLRGWGSVCRQKALNRCG